MKLNKENIKIGLIVLVVILTSALLVSVFRKGKTPDDNKALFDAYAKIIQAKDETIKVHERIQAGYEADKQIQYKRDSILIQLITNNQPKYVENEKKYNRIPAVVSDYSKDELRREVSNY